MFWGKSPTYLCRFQTGIFVDRSQYFLNLNIKTFYEFTLKSTILHVHVQFFVFVLLLLLLIINNFQAMKYTFHVQIESFKY